MISGRVLDTTALLDAGTGLTEYFRAFMIIATRYGTTLVIPTTAWTEAWALSPPSSQPFLNLMADHPLVVFDTLDAAVGRHAGLIAPATAKQGIDWSVTVAHVAAVAVERDFPVLTRRPGPLLNLEIGVRIEPLPKRVT